MTRIAQIVRRDTRAIVLDAAGLAAMSALLVLALHLPEVLAL